MAFDEILANRVRVALASVPDVTEKRMFGGVAFLVGGRMCCGLAGAKLMVRVDPADYDRLLAEPHASEMDFTGRPMRGFLYVAPEGVSGAAALARWVNRAVAFVERQPSAPTKRSKRPATGSKRGRTSRS